MAHVISEDCIACGTCIGECPTSSISEGEIYVIDPETCIDCAACADVCPTGAISQQ
ncbi:MAG: 4Fe-4S binding protein [Bacteroidaceae bacterium]|nr:4Fe-4S binding protein [Bacteroidaceae bacterium]